MRWSYIWGVIFALCLIWGAAVLSGASIAVYINLPSFLMVIGYKRCYYALQLGPEDHWPLFPGGLFRIGFRQGYKARDSIFPGPYEILFSLSRHRNRDRAYCHSGQFE